METETIFGYNMAGGANATGGPNTQYMSSTMDKKSPNRTITSSFKVHDRTTVGINLDIKKVHTEYIDPHTAAAMDAA